jgi:ribonuclease HIII
MTTTLKLTPGEIEELRGRLEGRGFEFRSLQHAHFQARGPAVVVSAYLSGSVVVQGGSAHELLAELGLLEAQLTGPVVGSDESGKGDYFGPLVVAAVLVTPAQEPQLRRMGVRDCKRMGNQAILRAARSIRELCPHAVSALTPAEYNARHEQEGNVAVLLAEMHADAIAATVGTGRPHVVIDQFTFPERLEEALASHELDLTVEIRPRAEDNPAVAAASVLARAEFLLALRELGHEYGTELPRGASQKVEDVARDLFSSAGMDALRALAKLHFKTTKRVTEELF